MLWEIFSLASLEAVDEVEQTMKATDYLNITADKLHDQISVFRNGNDVFRNTMLHVICSSSGNTVFNSNQGFGHLNGSQSDISHLRCHEQLAIQSYITTMMEYFGFA